MKKIIIFLIMFLSFNVYAETEYVYKKYVVELNGINYTVALPFEITSDGYSMDYTQMTLTSTAGVVIKYNSTVLPEPVEPENSFYDIMLEPEFYKIPNGDYILTKKDFTKEEFENDEYMKKYYPSFFTMNYDNTAYKGSIFAFALDTDKISYDDFYAQLNNYFQTDITFSKKTEGITSESDKKYDIKDESSSSGTLKDNYYSYDIEYSSDEYDTRASALRELLKKATNIKICTEDDLNGIRSQRNIDFYDLKTDFNAVISSNCKSVFDELYDKVLYSHDDIAKVRATKESASKLTMSFLFFETYYLQGFAFLTGETMQKEIKDVARCSIFGDKTYELLQRAFTIFKYAGLVLGTLLGTVDIFKAIVQKDESGKKQVKTLSKRIIAIILLFITPVLVEIIFEFISSIGIDDPICGIR